MRANHNQRLGSREDQNRGWAAPLPDYASMPRANEAPRQRVETDTRASINSRFWESVQISGPQAVTPAMLAAHPTQGAWDQAPITTRTDTRAWTSGAAPPYFPDPTGPGQRPPLPSSSVWANPHFDGWNPENMDTTRELRFAVKEQPRFHGEDASLRAQQRQFEHGWRPAMTVDQLAAADRLRPRQDDVRVSWLSIPGARPEEPLVYSKDTTTGSE